MGRTKLQLEFLFKASPNILYTFLTTPACIVRWFCDKAEVDEHQITYSWSGNEEVALILIDHEEEVLRLKWADSEYDQEYLEFKISESPVTGETILELTDFCDEGELNDSKQYWNQQIKNLQKECGG
ncbi:MAG: hypothetical protein RLZZ417_1826 [Bacteroidota bacterium]|jgi:hypothetical protein